jgi:TP901 family phage tail tape measure protein
MAFTPGIEQELAVQVKSEGVGGFAQSMDTAVGSVLSLRNAVGLAAGALGALATGALAEATQAAAEFNDSMVEIEKVASEEVAGEMRGEIQEMASEIPMAQSELVSLTADAARFGIEGSENLRSFTEAAAKMSTATTLSADEAGEAFAKLAELTDTPIENVENLGSAINELSNNFATSSQEIVDASLRSSGALSQLGLEQTEIFGLNASINEVSESAERAGTRLRRLAQEMLDPRKTEDLAAALGMSVDEFERMREESPDELMMQMVEAFEEGGDSADRLRETLGSASRQAIGGLAQNVNGLRDAMETSNTAFEENTSLQREFEKEMDTTRAKVQLLKNAVRNQAIEIGEVLLPYLNDALDAFTEFVEEGDSLLNALSSQEKAFGLVATAIGGTAVALATLVSGPVGLAFAAVAALGAAWATNFLGIRDVTERVIDRLAQRFQTVASIVLPVWRQFASVLQGEWAKTGDSILGDAQYIFDKIIAVITRASDIIFDGLIVPLLEAWADVWETHMQGFVSELLRTVDVVLSRIRFFVEVFEAIWNRWGDEILAVTKYIFDGIVTTVKILMDALLSSIRIVLALIRGDWKEAWNIAAGFFERTFNTILDFAGKWGGKFLDWLGNWISNILSDIGDWATDLYDDFTGGISDALSRGRELFDDFADWVIDKISGIASSVGSSMKSAINSALELPFEHTIGEVEVKGNTVFGGETVSIPALAEGGIVTEATLATVGEAGSEAVLPLDRLDDVLGDVGGGASSGDVVDRLDSLLAEVRESGGDVVLVAGERELARATENGTDRFLSTREVTQ